MPEFKIAATADVAPGQGRTIRVEGLQIALFNLDGDFVAIDDACPHMRADLSCGIVKERTVTCSWHGWEFDLDSGQCTTVAWARVRRYPLRVDGGSVHLILEPEPEPKPEDPMPAIVWRKTD